MGSSVLKVHRKERYNNVALKYSIMMCGMDIQITDFNYNRRVATTNSIVTCGNCLRVMKSDNRGW